MTTRHNLYFMGLVGATAGFGVWAIGAWIPFFWSLPQEQYWQAHALDLVLISLCICVSFVVMADRRSGHGVSAWRILGGALGGVLSAAVSFVVFQQARLHIPGTHIWLVTGTAWLATGASIGTVLSIVRHGLFPGRLALSACGGAVGGALGGVVLLGIGELLPYAARAVGLMLAGLGISLGSTLATRIVRNALLLFISSRITEVNEELGTRKRELELYHGDSWLIGRSNNGHRRPRFLHVPDPDVAEKHVYVESVNGHVQLRLPRENADPNGQALRPVTVRRAEGRDIHKLSAGQPLKLNDGDEIQVGTTTFVVSMQSHRRNHRRRPIFRAAALVFLACWTLADASAQSEHALNAASFHQAGKLRLCRVLPASERPAFRLTVNIVGPDGSPVSIPVIDPNEAQRQLSVTCNGRPLKILRVSSLCGKSGQSGDARLVRYAVLLVDVSASMRQITADGMSKFDAMKQACFCFVDDFVEGIDYVAIIPFSAYDVENRVRNASFMTGKDEIRATISDMPEPPVNASTGLYTAAQAALNLLDRKRRDCGSGTAPECILVVMTDGKNDVDNPGDYAGLLRDWRPVRETADKVGVQVITVGFGDWTQIDENALRNLAWPSAGNYFGARHTSDMVAAFRRARTLEVERLAVTFLPAEALREQLVREHRFTLTWKLEDGSTVSGLFHWLPSGLGAPPFEDTLTEAERGDPEGKTGWAGDGFVAYFLSLALFSLLLTFMWRGLPKRLWADEDDAEALYRLARSSVRDADHPE